MTPPDTAAQRVARIAATLVDAYRRHCPVAGSPETGPATTTEAFAVQAAVWAAMVGPQRPTAWKVGAASPTAVPVSGAVFPAHLQTSPACFRRSDFLSLGIEAEIALRFGRDLPARDTPYASSEILDAVASAHVAMEIVGTRLADHAAAGPLWSLADNLVNGALVIGDAIPGWRHLDYPQLTARSFIDDALVAEATGAIPLGDIGHCLPWWVGHIGGVRAGDVVTTGTWNGARWLDQPGHLRVEFAGLGSAEATLF